MIAADFWGACPRVKRVPPARPGSVEDVLHQALRARPSEQDALFVFPPARHGLHRDREGCEWYAAEREHRAIGVVYRPGRERWGNYVPTVLAERYDAFCHLDRATALSPLYTLPPDTDEDETWPTGL